MTPGRRRPHCRLRPRPERRCHWDCARVCLIRFVEALQVQEIDVPIAVDVAKITEDQRAAAQAVGAARQRVASRIVCLSALPVRSYWNWSAQPAKRARLLSRGDGRTGRHFEGQIAGHFLAPNLVVTFASWNELDPSTLRPPDAQRDQVPRDGKPGAS